VTRSVSENVRDGAARVVFASVEAPALRLGGQRLKVEGRARGQVCLAKHTQKRLLRPKFTSLTKTHNLDTKVCIFRNGVHRSVKDVHLSARDVHLSAKTLTFAELAR
jgi:ABC-type histidine transport system ATPase subunit